MAIVVVNILSDQIVASIVANSLRVTLSRHFNVSNLCFPTKSSPVGPSKTGASSAKPIHYYCSWTSLARHQRENRIPATEARVVLDGRWTDRWTDGLWSVGTWANSSTMLEHHWAKSAKSSIHPLLFSFLPWRGIQGGSRQNRLQVKIIILITTQRLLRLSNCPLNYLYEKHIKTHDFAALLGSSRRVSVFYALELTWIDEQGVEDAIRQDGWRSTKSKKIVKASDPIVLLWWVRLQITDFQQTKDRSACTWWSSSLTKCNQSQD